MTPPGFWACFKLFIGEAGLLKFLDEKLLIEINSDADKLCMSVAEISIPSK